MSADDNHQRLGSISTLWSVVLQARGGPGEADRTAQEQLLARYGAAIRRYLLGALHDEEGAEELYQEFAFRFVRGDYRNVQPERGRFRHYVKRVLYHLIANHVNQQRQRMEPLLAEHPEPVSATPPDAAADAAFLDNWREQLLARCWQSLDQSEAAGEHCFSSLLRFRAEHPKMGSAELAERIAAQIGRPLTQAGVRQMLHRARQRFAELLIDEVTQSLRDPGAGDVEQELGELGLLSYCQIALPRRGSRPE